MTTKELRIYLSTLALVPIAAAVLFVSQNKGSFLSTKAEGNTTNYSMTLSSYSGSGTSTETYYTKNGNPIKFNFNNCSKITDGLVQVISGSFIQTDDEVHGIKSIFIASNDAPDELGFQYTIYKINSGSRTFIDGVFNTEISIDVEDSIGFSVAFVNEYPVTLTSLTFTYTCI